VGVIGAIGPTVEALIRDPKIKLAPNNKILPQLVADMKTKENPDVRVLLYQGTTKEAMACAERLTDFHVILSLSVEDEPPAIPTMVGDTMVIGVGHKGKYVGVAVYSTAKDGKPEFRYQLVGMTEEFLTRSSRRRTIRSSSSWRSTPAS